MPQPTLSIEETLNQNARVPFVKRILFPDRSPVVPDPEDPTGKRVMTHKMSWSEADGNVYAYPSVMVDETGVLRDYGDAAFDEALRRRDFIRFDSPEQADWFTKNYKTYWDKIGFQPGMR
jgi:hypothetical protein